MRETRIRIYVVHLHEDDPEKCTALRMVRAGVARLVRRPPPGSILLDPYAENPLSRMDAERVKNRGVTVIDASWKKLRPETIARFRRRTVPRRLPFLIAANPPHYGLPFKLSSLEAVAAALYITGFAKEAERLLTLYKWGPAFLEVNKRLLKLYEEAETPTQVIEAEAKIFSEVLGSKVTPDAIPRLIARLAVGEETL